jgi:uncharacterized protein YecE (DUF72 family)
MAERRAPSGQLALFDHGPAPRAGIGPAAQDEATRALGAALPPGLRFGTSSWSFPGWVGQVWDRQASKQTLSRRGLGAYCQHPLFKTVGVDRTYYASVPTETYADWAAMVPEDFRFLVKAHEDLMLPRFGDHPRYGRRRAQENPRFLDPAFATSLLAPMLDGLQERAGVFLLQFSPMTPATLERFGLADEHAFADALHDVLTALEQLTGPDGPVVAVELRNPSLLTRAYLDALDDVGAVHARNAWGPMLSVRAQQQLAEQPAARALVFRWMLAPGLRYADAKARFAPFDAIAQPDEATRDAIAEQSLDAVRAGLPVYVIVNNKAEGSAPASIDALARRVLALSEAARR